ncbi:unnamed protein product, partial [Ectocarpus sp. 12 AP-2014]
CALLLCRHFFFFLRVFLWFLAKHHTPQFSSFSACTRGCPVPYSMYHSHSFLQSCVLARLNLLLVGPMRVCRVPWRRPREYVVSAFLPGFFFFVSNMWAS